MSPHGGVSSLMNGLFLLAAVLFLSITFIQTLREPPPPEALARWRLGPFWVGGGLRALSLVFAGIAVAAGMVSAIASGISAEWTAALPWMLGLAAGLAVLGAGALLFSVVLYWRPSAAKTHGF